MIKEYDLQFYASSSTDPEVLYNRYVDQIQQILIDSGIFTSVVANKPSGDSGTYADYSVDAYVEQDKVVTFSLGSAVTTTSGYLTLNAHKMIVPYNNGLNTYVFTESGTSVRLGIDKAYVTSNGVMLRYVRERSSASSPLANPTKWGSVLIAKSSKTHPLIVPFQDVQAGGDQLSAANMHRFRIPVVCYPDSAYVLSNGYANSASPYVYNYNTTAKQTVLYTFSGWGEPNGRYTYSKYALWVPFAPSGLRSGGFQKAMVDGKTFVTDGYFALRDE